MCKTTYVNIQTGEVLDMEKVSTLKENTMLRHSPHLFEEWDFEKNDELGLDSYQITKGSRKKVWWTCKNDNSHKWESVVYSRHSGKGCPFCSGRRTTIVNNLYNKYPKICLEWDYEKNYRSPNEYAPKSHTSVWWKCERCNDSYLMSISNKTNGTGCPYCNGKQVNKINSLASLNPELSNEWHPKLNTDLTPDDITSNSGKKVWWLGKCGHEWEAVIGSRNRGNGCPYCSGKKVLKGFNDMWTTNPELARLLADQEDGYKYTQSSSKRVDWKCPDCGFVTKNKQIYKMLANINTCEACSDGFKFPEKFMLNLLSQLNISFVCQKIFSWANNKRYDFYIPSLNMIIEVHGLQHYNGGFESLNGRTLNDEELNDRFKEQLAKENGIKHYIVIDSRYSDFEYIKASILKSDLVSFFKFDELDWISIAKNAQNSKFIEVCNFYNSNKNKLTYLEMGEKLKISNSTLIDYLKKGVHLGICDYKISNKEHKKIASKHRRIPIIQLNLEYKIIAQWESIADASKSLNKKESSSISGCCKGRNKTAYGYRWMYRDQYEKQYGKIDA